MPHDATWGTGCRRYGQYEEVQWKRYAVVVSPARQDVEAEVVIDEAEVDLTVSEDVMDATAISVDVTLVKCIAAGIRLALMLVRML